MIKRRNNEIYKSNMHNNFNDSNDNSNNNSYKRSNAIQFDMKQKIYLTYKLKIENYDGKEPEQRIDEILETQIVEIMGQKVILVAEPKIISKAQYFKLKTANIKCWESTIDYGIIREQSQKNEPIPMPKNSEEILIEQIEKSQKIDNENETNEEDLKDDKELEKRLVAERPKLPFCENCGKSIDNLKKQKVKTWYSNTYRLTICKKCVETKFSEVLTLSKNKRTLGESYNGNM